MLRRWITYPLASCGEVEVAEINTTGHFLMWIGAGGYMEGRHSCLEWDNSRWGKNT